MPKTMTPKQQSREERARTAFIEANRLRRGLQGVARVMTSNPKVTVEFTASRACTDGGDKIWLRVPIELGDLPAHDADLCQTRDVDSIQLCPRCAVLEEVNITLIHEIAHIVHDTFEKVSGFERANILKHAVEVECAGKPDSSRAAKIARQIDQAPAELKQDYLNLLKYVSPYLPVIFNAAEDVRVNTNMQEYLPGTRLMFNAQINRVFKHGIDQHDGTTFKWSEAKPNAQAILTVYCKVSNLDYKGWFAAEIEEALDDEGLDRICADMRQAKSARAVYRLCFPLLENLRRLGFCKAPDEPEDEPEPEPEPEPEEEPDEQDTDQGEESDSGDSENPTPDRGASDDSTDEDNDSDDSQPGQDSSDLDEGEAGPDDADDEGDGGTGSEGETGEDAEATENGGGSSEPGDSGAETEGGSESDADSLDGDEGAGDSDIGADGDKTDDGEPSGRSISEEDDPTTSGSTDEAEGGGGVGEETEPVSSEADSSGMDSTPPGDGPGVNNEPDPDATGGRDDGQSSGPQDASPWVDIDPDGESPADPSDGEPGADKDTNPAPVTQQDMEDAGTADDMERLLNVFGGHADKNEDEEKDKSWSEVQEERKDNEALERAVEQTDVFDRPSINIDTLKVVKYADHDRESWSTPWYRGRGRSSNELPVIPERIMMPSLQRLRLAFQDNKRAYVERNRKSGKVDTRVLGKRIATGDPRLFVKRTQPVKKDYFVIVGLDCSGSTSIPPKDRSYKCRLDLMKAACYAQCELLHRLGVDFAVYAHSGDTTTVEIFVIKEPREKWGIQQKEALATLQPYSANLDGHTLEFYRKVAQKARQTDKVILYFTDGAMPMENYEEELEILQDEIRTCRMHGIKLVGVGVETDSPTEHGLDTLLLNGISDIPAMVEGLRTRLS